MQFSATWPEAELAAAPASFEQVIQPHIPRLLGIARRFLLSEDLAEDAVQETLISLWKESSPPRRLAAWLNRTVANRSLYLRRTAQRRSHHESRAADRRTERLEREAREFVPHDPDEPSFSARIQAALCAMSASTRRAFWLREFHGLDYASIAAQLGIPLGTVRSRIHRARCACRACLAPQPESLALSA